MELYWIFGIVWAAGLFFAWLLWPTLKHSCKNHRGEYMMSEPDLAAVVFAWPISFPLLVLASLLLRGYFLAADFLVTKVVSPIHEIQEQRLSEIESDDRLRPASPPQYIAR